MSNDTPTATRASRILIAFAWIFTLFASMLPDMIWNQLIGDTPAWLFWLKAIALVIIIVLGWVWKGLRPLRTYFTLLLICILLWWVFTWIMTLDSWLTWTEQVPWAVGMTGLQLMKLALALLTIAALFLFFRRRKDFFLVRGEADADAEPVHWLGMKEPFPWRSLAPIVGICAAVIMLAVLWLSNQPSRAVLVKALPLLPLAFVYAATNAISEEISYRSSLLSPLYPVIGKNQALAMNAIFFGLAHYAGGVPLATLPTLFMTGFLGWFMGKAMLETEGFSRTWLIHFIADIPVFAFLIIGSVA